MEALRVIEAVAVIVAALAVTAFSVRIYLLAGRLQQLADQFSRILEEDVRGAVAEIEQAARRTQATLGKVDAALIPFGHTVRRIERWTATLATEALVTGALSPALAKVSGWLAGLRKGVSSVLKPH